MAVVRLSGPRVRDALARFVRHEPKPRVAELTAVYDLDEALLDRALVLFFPAPHSFTGEDVAEFHLHGSRALVQRFLRDVCSLAGVRVARPGEFTERAFENGKMDLLAVEDLADLIDSETELQRALAGGRGRSRFRAHLLTWREDILALLALVEAQIDFSDEEDVADAAMLQFGDRLAELFAQMTAVLADRLSSERLREGFQVVIAGPPNAGKSSLLNALAKRDVAIVSPIAGTTRDVLEVRLDLGGVPVLLRDVAGLRESDDIVERIGIERALAAMREADLVLWLDPADAPCPPPLLPVPAVSVISKMDLLSAPLSAERLAISRETGHGIAAPLEYILGEAKRQFRFSSETIMLNLRQEACLRSGLRHLSAAAERSAGDIEFLAEDLRAALFDLRNLVGEVGVEDVLGTIFTRFCIGK